MVLCKGEGEGEKLEYQWEDAKSSFHSHGNLVGCGLLWYVRCEVCAKDDE
jgi:hypothetical protein